MTDQTPATSKRLIIAEIVGSHGVRGDAKIRVYAEDTTLFTAQDKLYLSTDITDERTLNVTLKSPYKSDVWLCRIEGITAPEPIKAMGKTPLYVNADTIPALSEADKAQAQDLDDDDNDDKETFYYHDLEGLRVYQDENGEKGKEVGVVTAVQNFGAGDLLDIRARNGSQFFHPFSKIDVPVLNMEEGYLTIVQAEII